MGKARERREKICSFTAERQRESFSLKAPFCPGAVFRFESNLPCRSPAARYVYTLPIGSNGPAKKGFGLVTFPERGKFQGAKRRKKEKQPEFSSLGVSGRLTVFPFQTDKCNNFLSPRDANLKDSLDRNSSPPRIIEVSPVCHDPARCYDRNV